MTSIRILHIHSTFSLGGKEARAVRLMNAFGDTARHVVLSGVPGALGARDAIDPGIEVDLPADHPPLTGRPSLGRYRALARYMRGFDLVLTYNWGAMDAVMARRLFGGPPLVHHEDGFNADEAAGQKRERILFRRLALPGAARLVVPSYTLERIAHGAWRQPKRRVARIANGIPVEKYRAAPRADAIPGFARQAGRVTVGTIAGLRPVKNLGLLIRAVSLAGNGIDLVIVGEGPEREALERETASQRVTMPGFLASPHEYVGLFDIFALSSDSEQQPISLMEAMAAGLPVASTAVGDIPEMVSQENAPFLVPLGDEAGLAHALRQMADERPLRERVGAANRRKAERDFSEDAMIAAYRTLYADVLGQPLGRSMSAGRF
jgi:glycosyltransferase involved in cell wall biosynthesis